MIAAFLVGLFVGFCLGVAAVCILAVRAFRKVVIG